MSNSNEVITDSRLENRTRRRFSAAEKKRLPRSGGCYSHSIINERRKVSGDNGLKVTISAYTVKNAMLRDP